MAIKYARGRVVARASKKLIVAALVGLCTGLIVAAFSKWQFAVLVAWDVAALTYLVWTWRVVGGLDGELTDRHAVRDDPSRGTSDAVVLTSSIASLVAVATMIIDASKISGAAQILAVGFSVVSVVISWLTVHTLYMLRYAELYYTLPEGGVDFLDTKKPCYRDFAYLAFTMGMTFQVSDTALRTTRFRKVALGHAMISYVFATVIVASAMNLVLNLSM